MIRKKKSKHFTYKHLREILEDTFPDQAVLRRPEVRIYADWLLWQAEELYATQKRQGERKPK